MLGREWGRADPVDDLMQVEADRVGLVQGDFEHAGDHLGGSGQALGRGVDEGQLFGVQAGGLGHLGDDGGRRSACGFQHQGGVARAVPIAELSVEILHRGHGPARAGAEGEEPGIPRFVGERPAGILATQAGDDRIGRVHDHRVRPGRDRAGGRDRNGAEAAEADLGDAASGLDRAAHVGAGIDHAGAVLGGDGQAQGLGIGDQTLHQGGGQGVDAGKGEFRAARARGHGCPSVRASRVRSSAARLRNIALVAAESGPVANRVHSGASRATVEPGFGRSRTKAGQEIGGIGA